MRAFLLSVMLFMGIGMMGAAGIGTDYYMQKQKAEGPYKAGHYALGLFDRFGHEGGVLGMIFQPSMAVDLAMPATPVGWQQWYIDARHKEALYSAAQARAFERETQKVEARLPELDYLGAADRALWQAYLDDTTTAYSRGDSLILLYVADTKNRIKQPILGELHSLSLAHFAVIERHKAWRSFRGQEWREVSSPITRASNEGCLLYTSPSPRDA